MTNVFQRIQAVMNDVQYLKKDVFVQTGVSGRTGANKGYYALTAEKVVTALRPLLIKHGLCIIPTQYVTNRTDESLVGFDGKPRPNRITEIDAEYRIQNVDDPSDFVMACSFGQGSDAQDKGSGKAMTYSYKYLLTTLFAIPSGEDPDKIHSDEYTDELLSSYVPREKDDGDSAEERDRLRMVIVGLLRAQNRPDSDADDISLELFEEGFFDLTVAQLIDLKLAIARGE